MSHFSQRYEAITLEIDAGVLEFLKPHARAKGKSINGLLLSIIYAEDARLSPSPQAARVFTYTDKGVLSALLLQGLDPKMYESGPVWLTRAQLAQRTGVSPISIGSCVSKLLTAGDLICKRAEPLGRNGPPPQVYSLTPQGVQTAFNLDPDDQDNLTAVGAWEDRIGTPQAEPEPTREEHTP